MAFSFLRVLLPSWRFFGQAGDPYDLFHRVEGAMGAWGEWEPTFAPAKARGWAELFLNPEGNRRLAERTALDEFLQEIEDNGKAAQDTVPYRLVEKLVRERLREKVPAGTAFQFKLHSVGEDLVISPRSTV
jgi:hypothetical protein